MRREFLRKREVEESQLGNEWHDESVYGSLQVGKQLWGEFPVAVSTVVVIVPHIAFLY
jgi:hypothetical protein|tara:strand:- start:144 stop:317 length:174 start_codon:yes stop_codon:yes gene_type:complete